MFVSQSVNHPLIEFPTTYHKKKKVKATKVFHTWLIMGTDENGPRKSWLKRKEATSSEMFWCFQFCGVSVVTRVLDRLAMETPTMSKWYSIVMGKKITGLLSPANLTLWSVKVTSDCCFVLDPTPTCLMIFWFWLSSLLKEGFALFSIGLWTPDYQVQAQNAASLQEMRQDWGKWMSIPFKPSSPPLTQPS